MKIRNFKMNDLERIVEIRNLCYVGDLDFSSLTKETFLKRHDHKDISLERDFRVTELLEVVGYFGVLAKKSQLKVGKVQLVGPCVHPEFQKRGIGTKLMRKAIQNSKERGGRYIDTWLPAEREHSHEFVRKFGFQITRYFLTLRSEDFEDLPEAEFSKGVSFRNFVLDEDEENLAKIDNLTFKDHWGHTETTLEDVESFEKDPSFDPEGIFFALHNSRIVGFCGAYIDREYIEYTKDQMGLIGELGVLPDYRRRGIGRALLIKGMKYLKVKGMKSAEIGVDAKNPKAKKLYENLGFKEKRVGMVYRKKIK